MNKEFSGQSMAMFAGGLVAGAIVSRLLPPLLAQASGSARAAMGQDPFDALVTDHRHFLSLLTQMEESSDGATFNRTQLFLRLKRRLAAHALAEEDIVYPLLHDEAKAEEEARQLYGEHAEIKMHLHALEQMPKGERKWAQRAGQLRKLIDGHARQEEETEFPKLRKVLDEQRIARLSGDLRREKALIL